MLKQLYEKYVLRYYKILIAIGGTVVLCSFGFFIVYHYSYNEDKNSINQANDIVKVDASDDVVNEAKPNYYYIDIKGAVVNPNVYQALEGMRINDVIKLAGGLTDQADTSVLNLSKKISDEMTIIIYTKDEIAKFKASEQPKQEIIKYIEKDCNCPDPNINGACINNESNEGNGDISLKIALNSATKEDLMTLSGIGEVRAQDIIDYRATNGLFKSIDDIKNITGIGDSIFDKIKDFITL